MDLFSIIGQLLIGWLIADLLGGIVHWGEDRLGREDWPWLGRTVIAPNRRHHRDPMAFLAGSFVTRNLSTLVTAAIGAALWLLLFGPSIVLLSAAIGAAISATVHGWTHAPARAPRLVRVLQQIGILQSPAHHAGHHRPPSDRRYCVLTDFLNPALDALAVWSRLETLLARAGVTLSPAKD
jgi:ubiquitin-conjugating enzyme E2 variant